MAGFETPSKYSPSKTGSFGPEGQGNERQVPTFKDIYLPALSVPDANVHSVTIHAIENAATGLPKEEKYDSERMSAISLISEDIIHASFPTPFIGRPSKLSDEEMIKLKVEGVRAIRNIAVDQGSATVVKNAAVRALCSVISELPSPNKSIPPDQLREMPQAEAMRNLVTVINSFGPINSQSSTDAKEALEGALKALTDYASLPNSVPGLTEMAIATSDYIRTTYGVKKLTDLEPATVKRQKVPEVTTGVPNSPEMTPTTTTQTTPEPAAQTGQTLTPPEPNPTITSPIL